MQIARSLPERPECWARLDRTISARRGTGKLDRIGEPQ
jgi:hypothetical protein